MSKCEDLRMTLNKFIVLILVISLIGCGHAKLTNTASNSSKNKPAEMSDSVSEFIGEVKLNGVINFKDNLKNAVLKLGTSDSMTTMSDQKDHKGHFNSNISYHYFKGIAFQNINDTLILIGVDFIKFPTAYLRTEKIRLSNKTTFNDVKKVFPVSATHELSGSDMDKVLAIAIPASKSTPDNMWFLYFDRNTKKLLRINYWVSD